MRTAQKLAAVMGFLMAMSGLATGQTSKVESTETVRTEVTSIPFETHFELSRRVGAGRTLRSQEGKPGQIIRDYLIVTKGGKEVSKTLMYEERIEPVHEVFLVGREGYAQSRGAFTRSKVLTMTATAYDPSPATIGRGATGRTATGMKAAYGVVAVDPRVIPLGTLVYVEGYGLAIAADKGSAIKGNKIDLCYATRREALNFGRKTVKVHVLKPKD
ncbi:MAG: hypothetical protein AMXMBFR81_11360 [Chthonomonas sp.]